MSIGSPAARRVTDVELGDCTTCNPCKETGEETDLFVQHLYFSEEIQAQDTTHLFQHASRDIPKLWITAAQQRGAELGEACAASLYRPLVKINTFFKTEPDLRCFSPNDT